MHDAARLRADVRRIASYGELVELDLRDGQVRPARELDDAELRDGIELRHLRRLLPFALRDGHDSANR